MKPLIQIVATIAASFMLIGGCTKQDAQSYATPANVQVAATLVCSNTLTFAVNDSDRGQVANYIYSIAHGIRTLTTGQVPTPTELQNTINLFSPGNGAKWATLGTSIGAIYGGIYNSIGGDGKKAIDYLNALATGCETAAGSFVSPAHATPTP